MTEKVATIDRVIERLEDIVRSSIATGDRLGYFAALYTRVTRAIREAIEGGEFDNGERMRKLDVAFATRYLDARERYQNGDLHLRAWLQAFRAAQSDDHIILQQLLISMNPHINLDLAIAVARTCPADELASLKPDFDKINEILASQVPVVEKNLDEASPVTYRLTEIIGSPIQQKVLEFSMKEARDAAWKFANELAHVSVAEQSGVIAKRDSEACLFGDAVLAGGPLVRLVRRGESQDVSKNIETLMQTGMPASSAPRMSAPPVETGPDGSDRWSDAFLDPTREEVDPIADAVVRELFEHGRSDEVTKLWKTLVENDEVPEADLPPVAKDYFAQTAALPDWADPDRIARGQEFFEANTMGIVAALNCAALPQSYAASKGVQVLWLNGRLLTDAKRRVMETAQLIFDVGSIGGLEPHGHGIRSTQKVRLMHAAIRHLIGASGEWDPAFGRPINQEDLVGTLLMFTSVVIDALDKLGADVERGAAEDYFHTWRVVGAVLGIRPDMLPNDLDDAAMLLKAIRRRQFARTEAGVKLAAALLEYMDEMLPGHLFDGFPATTTRYLLGDGIADLVDVPKDDWTHSLTGAMKKFFGLESHVEEHSVILRRMVGGFSHALMTGFLWADRGGKRGCFRIPDRLHEAYRLPKPHTVSSIGRARG